MLPTTTTVGPVSLFVPDLEKSKRFYQDVIGFRVIVQADVAASMGTPDGHVLLELIEKPEYSKPGRRFPGLFHFAVLFPSRVALGKELIHLAEAGWRLSGAGDHLVSEALYLDDPDGNGIELYVDRPKETWPYRDGHIHMDTLSVDIDSIIAEAKRDPTPWNGLPLGTTMGHVHLKVTNIDAAEKFYNDVIGFEKMTSMPQALFVSAGGYHHHLGLNTWMSEGSPVRPPDSLGLASFAINVPAQSDLEAILDRLSAAGIPFERTESSIQTQDPSANRLSIQIP